MKKAFVVLFLFALGCTACKGIGDAIPAEMDYYGLYAFHCAASEKYPLETDEEVETLQGEVHTGHYSSKAPFLYCLVIDDKILWNTYTDDCQDVFEVPGSLQRLAVRGYTTGEKVATDEGDLIKFLVIDLVDYRYVSCNICCNKESAYFADQKQSFWFQPGLENPFPDEHRDLIEGE
ncbi:MAG: hypothetical protein JW726_13065 [Anaerolineales bacterium]|nr:hypothetical protein [Anaerolineales bacterium]